MIVANKALDPISVSVSSVFEKDVDVDNSLANGWVDQSGDEVNDLVLSLFRDIHETIHEPSSSPVKSIVIHFLQTINAHQVGLGANSGFTFSNTRIILLGSGGFERTVVDDSTNSLKYSSKNYSFEPQLFNAVKIEFLTTDVVGLSNITIQKSTNVGAQIQGLRADGILGTVNVTNGNNLKVSLEELETQVSVNNNTQLRTTIFDSSGLEMGIDKTSGSVNTVDYAHHEIHDGHHFFIEDYTTLGNGQEIDIIIETPNSSRWSHFLSVVNGSAVTYVDVYEDVSESGDGTPVVILNNNRNSIETSVLSITKNPTTISNTGTRLGGQGGGSAQGSSGSLGFTSRGFAERVLKQNSKYLIRIASGSLNNIVSWEFSWYEHISNT